jgi:1-acyl-sn-glycerol-3-phosphate acyltransferase
MENLDLLPDSNVLFVSNHQTYYTDVITMYHIFGAHKWGFRNSIRNPLYLLSIRVNTYFIAAEETMKESGILPKLLTKAGAITVKRTWRKAGEAVQRNVDMNDVQTISKALKSGWVVTFPQGTTKPFAPARKGTALLIKEHQPMVVPIVINGFRRAFNKQGFLMKKRKTVLSVTIKPPIDFGSIEDKSPEEVIDIVMDAIEQSDQYRFKHYQRIASK